MVPDPLGDAPERRPRTAQRALRTAAALAAALMLWSLAAAPPSVGQDPPVEEPADLSAYATFGDAAPVQLYFDHQARFVPLGPALAHSQSEVSLPSQASGIAWLVDGGLVNGVHGTTTGTKVPTEASAKQPGGEASEEFLVAGGPIGSDAFAGVRAGRAFAEARHSSQPRAYSSSFFSNFFILPAAGSPPDPPGTYDPDARFPGGDPDETDPQPRGQMAIFSIGHIASTAESIREAGTIRSVAVAELKDINIGNRTSDNRCTNCIRIDSIRAEAFAEANGQPGGARGSYRVIVGRTCRRSFNADEGAETDRCLPFDPHDPAGSGGLQQIREVEALNRFFEEPIWIQLTDGAVTYTVGIRIHVGAPHHEPSRSGRTTAPPDDPQRNYGSDSADGEEARAVAEGADVEVFTITASQVADDAESRIMRTPAGDLLRELDADRRTPGIQLQPPGPVGERTGPISIPTGTVRSVRRVHLALGVARASAVARPAFALAPVGGGLGGPAPPPVTSAPPPAGPGGALGLAPPPPPGAAPSAGLPTGPFHLRIAGFRVRPWPPYDMAKAIMGGGMLGAAVWLLRRRLLTG